MKIKKTNVKTTGLCKKILKMNYRDRQLKYVEQMMKHEIFKCALNLRFTTGLPLVKAVVIDKMRELHLYHVNTEDMLYRRSSTIIRWIEWIISLIQE